MTRNEAAEYGEFIGLKPPTYTKKVTMIDTILALKQFEICGNCKYFKENRYCSKIDDRYTEHYSGKFMPKSTFGCNEFKPYK